MSLCDINLVNYAKIQTLHAAVKPLQKSEGRVVYLSNFQVPLLTIMVVVIP